MTTLESQSVESFSLVFEGWNPLLQCGNLPERVEEMILSRLEAPERLLRWAVVQVDGNRFRCEGAYLKAGR